MANIEQLTVTIMGRQYPMSCAADEKEALLNAVAYVDEKMTAIRDHGKINGNDRIAVFAALNIAHELLSGPTGKKSADKLAFLEFQHRIENLKSVIDEVLAPQDKLL